jgi:putative transcriptional regulator
MSLPAHHLDEDVLLDYATGSATESVGLVAACHLTLCPACRERLAASERVGGALLETAAAVPVAKDALARVLARVEERDVAPRATGDAEAEKTVAPDGAFAFQGVTMPRPLARYLSDERGIARSLRFIAPGVRGIELPVGVPRPTRARLVRLAPGLEIPHHAHGGSEYTLVLSGRFDDDGETYARGDLRYRAAGDEHVQRIDRGAPCFALTINEGALIPRNWRAKILSLLFDRH